MKSIKHLEKLRKIKRKRYHPLIHKIHKKHEISKKTLFYVKEYGPHANIPRTIIKESIKVLLLASIISSFGGLAIEHVKFLIVSLFPLVILLPALNDMIGSYGTVMSSKFSTMLHERKVGKKWWLDHTLSKLFVQIFIISIITTLFSCSVALFISGFSSYSISVMIMAKFFFIIIIDVILLIAVLFLTSVFAGMYFYKKGEDPNNFLIPITTSIADFGNMVILSLLVVLFF